MEREFNLLDENWICVRLPDCSVKEVSLKEALFNAHKYVELAGETKTQDFAVLRFVLALMHTVFSRYDAEGNEVTINKYSDFKFENWKKIWELKQIPQKPFEKYFEKWGDRFWLFDEEHPFYQSNAVNGKTKETCKTAKMIGTLFESGNKPRLFSERSEIGKSLSYGEAARWLLHLNCFDDIAAKKPTPKKTWVSKLGLIAVRGENLFETIMLNYVTDETEEKSCPSWEDDNNSDEFNKLINVPDNQAALLSLISRKIYLCRNNGSVSEYYIGGGNYFEDEELVKKENMSLWVKYKDKKETKELTKPKKYDTSKKIWREFGAIAAANDDLNTDNQNETEYKKAGVINWITNCLIKEKVLNRGYFVNVETAAVIYDYTQATSLPVIDNISDSLTFHSQLLIDVGRAWRKRVNAEIGKCEKAANCVYYLSVNLQKAAGASADESKGNSNKTISGAEAKADFYSRIDHQFRLWLAELTPNKGDEYQIKLDDELKNIALGFGREMASQMGDKTVFGRYKKREKGEKDKKGENDIMSSAVALNMFSSGIYKVFKKEGDDNEQK